ncbi:hypothetical protein CH289_04925 [Rhodococcus sp. RS1C4]|nr:MULTISPECIES: phosphatase PAP2 family protein [unclassified Rhodococcus (in: high G+C Gram-positive bacteria)]OZC56665.1 hypothetical protein CH289_04925 [Rhodococcus sp. RS1C4]OZC86170.1 hypothetical protein CH282_12020 [Rhodococcus sp. 06-418-1B]
MIDERSGKVIRSLAENRSALRHSIPASITVVAAIQVIAVAALLATGRRRTWHPTVHPTQPNQGKSPMFPARPWIRPFAAALLAFAAPLAVGTLAATTAVTEAGLRFHDRIALHRAGWATALAEFVTDCAQPVVGIVVAIGIAAWLTWRSRRVDAAWALAVMASTLVVSTIEKYSIREPRPPQRFWLMPPDTVWSFPSGHTAVAAAMIGLVALLTARAHVIVRRLARTTSVLFALAVAASRLYLGVHFPLDVAASFLAASTALLALWTMWSIPPVRHWVNIRLGPTPQAASPD